MMYYVNVLNSRNVIFPPFSTSLFPSISPTFEQFLLPVLFIQVDDNRSRRFLALLLPPSYKALLQRQEAVHLIAHQQHTSVLCPVLHHLGPGRCVPG